MDKQNLNSKVQKDFLNYANAVIKSRAISSVQDNLKPVHRRILFGMNELKLQSKNKEKKSARIVGDVVGKYHPHGDTSVYDAMVRLAQPWKMRYPLITMQGNMGSISGDRPAAMRYTEAKLSKYGDLMLQDINKNSVPFKENYDGTEREPIILPSIFPNILCNGNSGIAVGLSANLVPHNLKEVVNATVSYLNFKGITTESLMKHIPAPDFPTGGVITDAEKLKDIYATGQGTITIRSKYKIEQVGQRQHIVFTEIPYLVNIEEGIVDKIKKLVVEEEFDLIDDYENNTGKGGVELRIILKKGANVYRVLETLWQNTRLQITQRISNTLIYKGNPKVFSLKELIQHYVEHRHNVIINISKTDLEKTQNRILVVKALLTALDKIDDVISLIKNSENNDDARAKLIKLLSINEYQANAILDMKLSRLNKLDNIKLKSELTDLQEKEKVLTKLISDETEREKQMRVELLEMATKYGDDRRTTVTYGNQGAAEGMPVEPVKILFFENGATFVTQQPLEKLDLKRKTSPLNASPITAYIETKTDREITVFTDDGTLTKLKVLTMAMESLEQGMLHAKPLAAFDFNQEKLPQYMVFVTSAGIVKKTSTSEYISSKNNSRTIKLKGDQTLIFVGMANDTDNIALLDDKLAYFKVKEITPTSKLTIGSKGISTNNAVGAAIVSDKDKLLMVNGEGKAKLTNANTFVSTAKGANGQVITENTQFIAKKADAYFVYDGSKNQYIEKNPLTKAKTAVGSKIFSAPKTVIGL